MRNARRAGSDRSKHARPEPAVGLQKPVTLPRLCVCVFVHKHGGAGAISSITEDIPEKYQVCACVRKERQAFYAPVKLCRVQLRLLTPADFVYVTIISAPPPHDSSSVSLDFPSKFCN